MERCVLVVDDDESILEFVKSALSDEGYKVFTAQNGAVALDILAHFDEDLCLVLLDMRMPVMDGYAFLDVYCQQSKEPAPIIAVSAQVMLEGDTYCIKEFLPKPFDLDVLLDLINKYDPQS